MQLICHLVFAVYKRTLFPQDVATVFTADIPVSVEVGNKVLQN